MLGTTGLVGTSSGEGGSSSHEGGGEVVGSSSIMSGGIGDDDKSRGGGGGDFYEGDRSSGGNRWPRQETIALLKIRSDMDVVFRDSSLKGPLWDEVSRKMAELGYHRSAKKCKEKFENVYKYHKRTKDGRVGKADGKTYRFFEQLEALEAHHGSSLSSHLPPLPPATPRSQSLPPVQAAVPVTMVIPAGTNPANVTVTSNAHPISVVHTSGISPQHIQVQQQMNVVGSISQPQVIHQHHHHQHQPMQVHHSSSIQMENASSPSATPSSSSSTSSDEELLGRRKRKRKWKDFFERLMKDVIDKQEDLQKRFLDAVEKREHDRLAREEAWKMQEMARLNREHEILVQERSMAAAKDAALITFLQKLSDQQQIPLPLPIQAQAQTQTQPQPQIQVRGGSVPVLSSTAITAQQAPPPQPPPSQPQVQVIQPTQSQQQPQLQPQIPVTQPHVQESPVPLPQPVPQPLPVTQMPPQPLQQPLVVHNTNVDLQQTNNGDNQQQASSSRWPKTEVQALIKLRTELDQKYQENGPKGPLWEEISSAMRKLGYNRNAKRCKEKWENINKYFKKVKESNKRRPEDSKTCPYYHQLDALYREKTTKVEITSMTNANTPSYNNPTSPYVQPQPQMKPENLNTMGPIMAQHPEQQWQLPTGPEDDAGSENHDDTDEDDGDDEDDDDHGSGYEIVANNSNAAGNTATAE